MKLKKEKIEHIAKLARIELSEKDIEKYSNELNTILNFVEKLNKVETKNVEPTYQVSRVVNSYRSDKVIEHNKEEDLIKAAPKNNKEQIEVRAVLN